MKLRTIMPEDRQAVYAVEAQSTPNLRYLPAVFDMFIAEQQGEFFLAEDGDQVVACAKMTLLPDQTAWLETLRVIPAYQGRGIGKQLYQRYFQIAQRDNIATMRMYTGIRNLVSRGLAEYHGFQLEESFWGFSKPCQALSSTAALPSFQQVTDPAQALALLMPQSALWHDFVVMNRTFYRLSPALCHYLVERGMVYADPQHQSVVVLGARFSPEQAIHLLFFAGDGDACLQFAEQKAQQSGTQQLSCIFPEAATAIHDLLRRSHFEEHPSPYIVMKVTV